MPKSESKNCAEHLIISFQLYQRIDPVNRCLTVIARMPDSDLQTLEPVKEGEERLYKMYICDPKGKLVKMLTFTESDYRQVAQDYLNSDFLDNGESLTLSLLDKPSPFTLFMPYQNRE